MFPRYEVILLQRRRNLPVTWFINRAGPIHNRFRVLEYYDNCEQSYQRCQGQFLIQQQFECVHFEAKVKIARASRYAYTHASWIDRAQRFKLRASACNNNNSPSSVHRKAILVCLAKDIRAWCVANELKNWNHPERSHCRSIWNIQWVSNRRERPMKKRTTGLLENIAL